MCRVYKYLGVHITKNGTDSLETKNRIAPVNKAIRKLNRIWWSEEVTENRKKSILVYVSEA